MVWYPNGSKPNKVFKVREYVNCPVCYGRGEKKDLKTKLIRPCALCQGTGSVKQYK